MINLITGFGVLAVLLVIYAESGLLIGFFFPGDSLLFTSGYLVYQGIFDINIQLFVALLALAAILGDSTGYAFGHKVGRRLFQRPNSRFFKQEHLRQTEEFYQKYGVLAIILARFVPVVRTFAPIVAGVSKMKYRTFLTFNVIGGVAWTAIFSYLGYFVGRQLTAMGINIEIITILIVLLSILPIVIPILKNKASRDKLIQGTKRQLAVIFGRK